MKGPIVTLVPAALVTTQLRLTLPELAGVKVMAGLVAPAVMVPLVMVQT